MLKAIENLHKSKFIHWDIKPENFVLSLDEKSIFLIDYGLCHSSEIAREQSEESSEKSEYGYQFNRLEVALTLKLISKTSKSEVPIM